MCVSATYHRNQEEEEEKGRVRFETRQIDLNEGFQESFWCKTWDCTYYGKNFWLNNLSDSGIKPKQKKNSQLTNASFLYSRFSKRVTLV